MKHGFAWSGRIIPGPIATTFSAPPLKRCGAFWWIGARRRNSLKRGGAQERVPLDQIDIAIETQDSDLLRVHEALEKLAAEDPVKAELVKLRFFVGLRIPEAAEILGLSATTAKRYWTYARAWLYQELTKSR
jgi:RNA polymerase sigma factor (TIGR02999 family)